MIDKHRIKAITALIASFATATFAQSQTAPTLEEVLVTAQKREQSIQDVPLSIVLATADDLQQNGVDSALELQRLVPNFYAARGSTVSNTRFVMRGIGTAGNTAVDQSIAVFLDGIYIARPSAIYSSFLDIASVEVVRGPQGTLFGRNTTAGGIILNSVRPTMDNEFQGRLEAGNYNSKLAEVIGNVVVSDKAAFRLAAQTQSRDGYGTVISDGSNFGDEESWTVRGSGAFNFDNNVSWDVRVDAANITGDGQNANEVVGSSLSAAGLANLTQVVGGPQNLPELSDPTDFRVNHVVGGDLEDKQWGISSDLSWDLDNGFTLSLISGYRDYENLQDDEDIFFLPFSLVGRTSGLQSESWSQELRLISPEGLSDGRLSYVAGLYYYEEDATISEQLSLTTLFCDSFAPPALQAQCSAGPLEDATDLVFTQTSESLAGYFQADYDLSNTLTLQVGGRYTSDDRSGRFYQQAENGFAALALRGLEDTDLDFSDDTPTYRIGLNFTPKDDRLYFASYSTGYKSGGFDSGGGVVARDASTRTFDSEEATNMELGFKGRFFAGRFDASVTLYRMEISDFQARSFDGSAFNTRNAGELRHQGLEAEWSWAASQMLTIAGGFAYLDSEFTDFVGAPALPGCDDNSPDIAGCGPVGEDRTVQDLTGGENHFAPEYTGNVRANLEGDLGNWRWRGNLSVSYIGEQFLGGAIDNNPQMIEDGYVLTSSRLTFISPQAKYELALFGDNLTDEDYCALRYYQPSGAALGVTDSATGGTMVRCNPGAPRTVGVSVAAYF
ncbi:Pesticin receptor [Zhongshania aliphaticivorans]|uniref:Pesticin receptor n=1 Tax=Zhongshania aliphaticivorans TaxID=1470434 RepID=A0A5S9Q7B6_9GAMM|nr:TonB-dependent receptor [Zhongshania aliphaticivorans]CAA0086928.1 Pesticin receptor [Zhongshania aliphaticivorans]CAA0113779.1 Pesticin receptor [Zhongshania aliphaticivorans]